MNTDHVYGDALKGLLALVAVAGLIVCFAYAGAFAVHVMWTAVSNGWDDGGRLFQ
jgi:hypothetical protein